MKNFLRYSSAVLLIVTTATAAANITTCRPGTVDYAIAESWNQRWQAALKSTDPDELRAMYAESAVLMPPSDETLVGREPVSTYLADHATPAHEAQYSVDLVACERHGDALHIAGVWGVPGRGTNVAPWTSGNLLRVLTPTAGGEWVSSYEIWN